MKLSFRKIQVAFSVATFGVCLSTASAAERSWQHAAVSSGATVREVAGKAEYAYDSRGWKTLDPGKQLLPGAAVRAEHGGFALLQVNHSTAFLKVNSGAPLLLIPEAPMEEISPVATLTTSPQGEASVRSIRGTAEVFQNGQWLKLKVNAKLERGVVVRTHRKTTMDLFFRKDGLVVRMNEKTRLSIHDPAAVVVEEQTAAGQPLLALHEGAIQSNLGKLRAIKNGELQSAAILYRAPGE